MWNCKNILIFNLSFIQPLFSIASTITFQPEFVGGLNIQQINHCEKVYKKKCNSHGETAVEALDKQWKCTEQLMAKDKSCIQAYTIRKTTSYPPTAMRQYKKIVVFNITTLADAKDAYFIVDTYGRVIELTDDIALVSKDPVYLSLKKKYPDLSFTSSVFYSKSFEGTFPKIVQTSNSIMQLIFKQELRDGSCVACKPVGIVYVAYQFKAGKFLNIKLIRIKSSPSTFRR